MQTMQCNGFLILCFSLSGYDVLSDVIHLVDEENAPKKKEKRKKRKKLKFRQILI